MAPHWQPSGVSVSAPDAHALALQGLERVAGDMAVVAPAGGGEARRELVLDLRHREMEDLHAVHDPEGRLGAVGNGDRFEVATGQAGRTLMKLGLVYHTAFEFGQAHRAFEEGFALWQQPGARAVHTGGPSAPHPLRIRWRRPYTLDPGLCGDYVSAMVIDQMFRGLVSTTPDLDVVPEVAQRWQVLEGGRRYRCLLYTSPSPRDRTRSRMPSSA